MTFDLSEINKKVKSDPSGFVNECDTEYEAKISASAERICQNISQSPIVLLSGPSGSGKTTTAKKNSGRAHAPRRKQPYHLAGRLF